MPKTIMDSLLSRPSQTYGDPSSKRAYIPSSSSYAGSAAGSEITTRTAPVGFGGGSVKGGRKKNGLSRNYAGSMAAPSDLPNAMRQGSLLQGDMFRAGGSLSKKGGSRAGTSVHGGFQWAQQPAQSSYAGSYAGSAMGAPRAMSVSGVSAMRGGYYTPQQQPLQPYIPPPPVAPASYVPAYPGTAGTARSLVAGPAGPAVNHFASPPRATAQEGGQGGLDGRGTWGPIGSVGHGSASVQNGGYRPAAPSQAGSTRSRVSWFSSFSKSGRQQKKEDKRQSLVQVFAQTPASPASLRQTPSSSHLRQQSYASSSRQAPSASGGAAYTLPSPTRHTASVVASSVGGDLAGKSPKKKKWWQRKGSSDDQPSPGLSTASPLKNGLVATPGSVGTPGLAGVGSGAKTYFTAASPMTSSIVPSCEFHVEVAHRQVLTCLSFPAPPPMPAHDPAMLQAMTDAGRSTAAASGHPAAPIAARRGSTGNHAAQAAAEAGGVAPLGSPMGLLRQPPMMAPMMAPSLSSASSVGTVTSTYMPTSPRMGSRRALSEAGDGPQSVGLRRSNSALQPDGGSRGARLTKKTSNPDWKTFMSSVSGSDIAKTWEKPQDSVVVGPPSVDLGKSRASAYSVENATGYPSGATSRGVEKRKSVVERVRRELQDDAEWDHQQTEAGAAVRSGDLLARAAASIVGAAPVSASSRSSLELERERSRAASPTPSQAHSVGIQSAFAPVAPYMSSAAAVPGSAAIPGSAQPNTGSAAAIPGSALQQQPTQSSPRPAELERVASPEPKRSVPSSPVTAQTSQALQESVAEESEEEESSSEEEDSSEEESSSDEDHKREGTKSPLGVLQEESEGSASDSDGDTRAPVRHDEMRGQARAIQKAKERHAAYDAALKRNSVSGGSTHAFSALPYAAPRPLLGALDVPDSPKKDGAVVLGQPLTNGALSSPTTPSSSSSTPDKPRDKVNKSQPNGTAATFTDSRLSPASPARSTGKGVRKPSSPNGRPSSREAGLGLPDSLASAPSSPGLNSDLELQSAMSHGSAEFVTPDSTPMVEADRQLGNVDSLNLAPAMLRRPSESLAAVASNLVNGSTDPRRRPSVTDAASSPSTAAATSPSEGHSAPSTSATSLSHSIPARAPEYITPSEADKTPLGGPALGINLIPPTPPALESRSSYGLASNAPTGSVAESVQEEDVELPNGVNMARRGSDDSSVIYSSRRRTSIEEHSSIPGYPIARNASQRSSNTIRPGVVSPQPTMPVATFMEPPGKRASVASSSRGGSPGPPHLPGKDLREEALQRLAPPASPNDGSNPGTESTTSSDSPSISPAPSASGRSSHGLSASSSEVSPSASPGPYSRKPRQQSHGSLQTSRPMDAINEWESSMPTSPARTTPLIMPTNNFAAGSTGARSVSSLGNGSSPALVKAAPLGAPTSAYVAPLNTRRSLDSLSGANSVNGRGNPYGSGASETSLAARSVMSTSAMSVPLAPQSTTFARSSRGGLSKLMTSSNDALHTRTTMTTIAVTSGAGKKVSRRASGLFEKSNTSGNDLPAHLQGELDQAFIQLTAHMPPPRKVSATQLLIQVIAVAIDEVDRMIVREKLKGDSAYGFVPGRSFCGRVMEAGWEVKGFRKGDVVFGLQEASKVSAAPLFSDGLALTLFCSQCGALAEFMIIDRHLVAKAPEDCLTTEQIAALPATGVMAFQIMRDHCSELPRGARILILNAHDSVGLLAMQECVGLGLIIVAHCPPSASDGYSICQANGAHEVIVGEPLWAVNSLHESSFDLVSKQAVCRQKSTVC